MKKNFIKQLACVLTLAMVISTVAPAATAVEAAKASSLNATAATIAVGGKFDINVKNKVKGTKYSYDYMYAAGKNYVTLNKKTGLVTAKKAGKATIKCTAKNGKTTKILKCVITVAPKATKVEINNKEGNTTIKVGSKFQFKATTTPSTAGGSNVWSISDASVFAFDKKNGYVRALKPGKATLTVTNGSVSDKVELVAAADYSATQAGAKTIKVTSPVMLKEGDIKVTKGNSNVALADKGIKLADDKLSAEITTSGRLVDGAYSVTLNAEKKLDFTAATEKVSKIEILSDKAALTAPTSSQATVGYKVTNQFSEDMTKSTSVQISGSHNASGDGKGTITFDKGSIFNQNVDVVSVVIIHTESGITAQAQLTVSAAKAVSDITVLDTVYNEDNKDFNGDSDLNKDDFYVLFEAKDQYGGEMTEIRLLAKGSQTPEAYITVASGLTKLAADEKMEKTKKITINGKNYAGVKLKSNEVKDSNNTGKIAAGTATVNVIGGLGKQANSTITVKDGIEAVTFSATPTDTVIAGNENEFTYSATDAYGNSVTKYDVLKKVLPSDANMKWTEDYSTGNAILKYHAPASNYDTQTVVTFQLTNYKTEQARFSIKANAAPRVITKVDKDLNVMADGKMNLSKIEAEQLKMENQYGSEISWDNLKKSGYTVKVTTASNDNTNIVMKSGDGSKTLDASNELAFDFKESTSKNEVAFIVESDFNTEIPASVVEKEYTLKLYGTDGKYVSGSDLTLTISVLPQGKLTGYAVEDIKPIYVTSKAGNDYKTGGDFGREIKVTAKRSGTTVVLEEDQYNIIPHGDLNTAGKKIFASKDTEFKDGVTEIKTTVDVVVNATGDTFKKEVILTNVDPKVTSVKADAEVQNISGVIEAANLFATGNLLNLEVKSNYDNDKAKVEGGKVYYTLNDGATASLGDIKDLTPRITFTDWSKTVKTPEKNGTKEAKITLAAGESVLVALDFGNNQIVKVKLFAPAK